MRKVFAIAAMGLLILSVPALAVVPPALDPFDGGTSGSGGPRSAPCPGTVIWDYSGAGDCVMPPTSCGYVGNMALCFVNADTTGSGGFPEPDRREMAGQWIATDTSPLTHVKVWYRFNTAGYFAFNENPGTIHGWCVKVWEANMMPPCPDGSIPGADAGLGVKVYDQYAASYTYEKIRGLADDPACGTTRHYAFCITLPVAFYPVADKTYWIVATPDEDCYYYTITDPTYSAYSYYIFNYMRMAPGLGIVCEASFRDGWNAYPWAGVSNTAYGGLACFSGWDAWYNLYSGEIPVATEPTTWGKIKASYR